MLESSNGTLNGSGGPPASAEGTSGTGSPPSGHLDGRHGAVPARPEAAKLPWICSARTFLVVAVTALAVTAIGCGTCAIGRTLRRITEASSQRGSVAGVLARSARTGTSGQPLDPNLFAAGSCVAFAPLVGNRHQTVFVDAGHGGLDPGAVGSTESDQTVHEADETLAVELGVMSLLRDRGYRVVVSRTKNATVVRPLSDDITGGLFTDDGARDDVAARDVCANIARANLLVGIYFDAGTSATNAGSITAYDATRPFSAQNLKFATLLQNDVLTQLNAKGWGVPNNGVVSDVSLGGPPLTTTAASYDHLLLLGPADPGYFTTPSQMPGALTEPLYITDPTEATIANSPSGHQAIAAGMAQAVEQYFGTTGTNGKTAGGK